MGLLTKTNPAATRASVIRHAMIWAVITTTAYLGYCLWSQSAIESWLPLTPLIALFGAAIGGLMEWQLDDGMELYQVVLKVEDEFGVKIPNWEAIETVGDLYRSILIALRLSSAEDRLTRVDEQQIWIRLQGLLARELHLPSQSIVPSARFYLDLEM